MPLIDSNDLKKLAFDGLVIDICHKPGYNFTWINDRRDIYAETCEVQKGL